MVTSSLYTNSQEMAGGWGSDNGDWVSEWKQARIGNGWIKEWVERKREEKERKAFRKASSSLLFEVGGFSGKKPGSEDCRNFILQAQSLIDTILGSAREGTGVRETDGE